MKAALLLASLFTSAALPAADSAESHRRADGALETFLKRFLSPNYNYLRARYPDDGNPTGYWTFAQGLDAVLDGVERTGGERFTGIAEDFIAAQEERGWYSGYYDDENWMVLALLRAHDLMGDEKHMILAEMLFQDIQGAWDETCCGAIPGGIWWNQAHTQKATASNAGPVIAAVRLAERLGRPSYLEFAKQVYTYWRENMVIPASSQVIDHINPDGTKVSWKFTYNEGLMIGAALELHRATGEEVYLEDAHRFAGFMVKSETTSTAFGPVLHDGGSGSCTGDCHQFKGIAYRYLMLLQEADPRPAYAAVLQASAEAIWELARDPVLGLFAVSWAGPVNAVYSEPQVSAAVMALNIFARASGPYPGWEVPPLQYEAEEAAFLGLGIDDGGSDFTGWGYLVGWIVDGRRVDFRVQVPRAARYRLAFRYAAGDVDAIRLLKVNGEVVSRELVFPALGFWDEFDDLYREADLRQGENTISLVMDYGQGSGEFLNLDHLRIEPLEAPFRRGDANEDGAVDLSDPIHILFFLFLGEPAVLDCPEAVDSNDDAGLDLSDAVFLLETLFLSGPHIPPPSAQCGSDPTPDGLDCPVFPPCPL